jgi:hypothetical protein
LVVILRFRDIAKTRIEKVVACDRRHVHRSGSTFSFNIAREHLQRVGRVVVAVADSFDGAIWSPEGVHSIIKGHAPADSVTRGIQTGYIRCICTIRKPEDAIASFMHTFGFDLEQLIGQAANWLAWYSRVASRVLTIQYQLIDEFPATAISLIDRYLTGDSCENRSEILAKKYSKSLLKLQLDGLQENSHTTNIGFSYYNKETLFHRRHISSVVSRSAEDVLSAADVQRIRTALSTYVNRNGDLRQATEWRAASASLARADYA